MRNTCLLRLNVTVSLPSLTASTVTFSNSCTVRPVVPNRAGIEDSIALLVERAYNRLLEQEQLEIGWDEVD